MDPIHLKSRHGPEWYIQRDFIKFLEARHWHVERLIGNAYQFGIPDLYIMHAKHGDRWVDLKRADGKAELTRAQRLKWPVWDSYGTGIWTITAATQEEYQKLFEPPNWREHWRSRYDKIPTREELIESLDGPDEK